MRRIRVLSLVAVAVLLLAVTPVQGAKTFVQWDWFDKTSPGGAKWWPHVEEFVKNEFGAELEINAGWNESQFPVAVSSGVPIDGIQVPWHQARNWAKAGLLHPITQYLERDDRVKIEDFIEGAFDPVTIDGEIYALPWICDFRILLLNVDLWEARGLDTGIVNTWDWSQFVTAAQKLTQYDSEGNVVCSGFSSWFDMWTWLGWLFTNGGEFYNEDQTAVAFNSPEGLHALEFLHDLYAEYRVWHPGFEGEQNIIAGKAGMLQSGPWVEAFFDFSSVKIDFAMFPKGPDADAPRTERWINYRAIPATTSDPDMAWEYLVWMNEHRPLKYTIMNTHRSPYIPFYFSDEWEDSLIENPHRRNWPEYMQMSIWAPVTSGKPWTNEVNGFISAAIWGDTPATTALSEAERIINAYLNTSE